MSTRLKGLMRTAGAIAGGIALAMARRSAALFLFVIAVQMFAE